VIILGAILAVIGVFFMVVAALGVAIFSDTFARLHCAGKSATLGVACMLLAAAAWSGDAGTTVRCIIAGLFFLATGPVGCHALARAEWRKRGHPRDADAPGSGGRGSAP
jgi:multicomponent Na+:H+ antiporter subunit G